MSKIQDVPFITKVIDTLSDELKSGLYDLIDGQVKTPVFRSLVNNDYAITEANDKGKVQFVTLETLRGNYTGYLAYNSVYCVLIAFKGNTQALDMLNINVAKHTFAFVNESLSILELRVELEDGKEGVTPTDLGVTNNNIHLAKGTAQIGEGVNFKTLDGKTLIGSGNVGFKTINDQEIVGDGNIVVGEGGTIAIDTALNESSTNAVQNKVITEYITDLESKVSTLAVKVYNHDVALGALNIENVLYSIANADSFAIPTTIGTNADVVIPKSRMALNMIKGKTEYSRNLLKVNDISPTTENGVTYSCSDGIITVNGTCTEQFNVFLATSANTRLPSGQLSYRFINRASDTYELQLASADNNTYINPTNENQTGTITNSSADNGWYFALVIHAGKTYSNTKFACMVVQGSIAPTSFVPYYTGLKNVELNSLNVYGKTDNYTKLNVGDKVTCIYISGEYAGPFLTVLSFDNGLNINGYSGWRGSHFGVVVSYFTNPISDFENIGDSNLYALKVGVVYQLKAPSKVTLVSTDLIKNATSVKSILPSSILPKTLSAYERLEVVEVQHDTYKIDLVSHEPLINGNSYNSLWIGNPQGINAYSSIFSMKKPDETYLLFENVSSENVIYNRIRLTASDRAGDNILLTSLLSNINELTLVASSWGNIPVFGGTDNYVSESTTNRNVVLKFSQSLIMNKINSSYENFDDNFRNGEETRTTLVSGLSLDDVSAIIDTGDIVCADNPNAEYDVSIAETSVELLVNKN